MSINCPLKTYLLMFNNALYESTDDTATSWTQQPFPPGGPNGVLALGTGENVNGWVLDTQAQLWQRIDANTFNPLVQGDLNPNVYDFYTNPPLVPEISGGTGVTGNIAAPGGGQQPMYVQCLDGGETGTSFPCVGLPFPSGSTFMRLWADERTFANLLAQVRDSANVDHLYYSTSSALDSWAELVIPGITSMNGGLLRTQKGTYLVGVQTAPTNPSPQPNFRGGSQASSLSSPMQSLTISTPAGAQVGDGVFFIVRVVEGVDFTITGPPGNSGQPMLIRLLGLSGSVDRTSVYGKIVQVGADLGNWTFSTSPSAVHMAIVCVAYSNVAPTGLPTVLNVNNSNVTPVTSGTLNNDGPGAPYPSRVLSFWIALDTTGATTFTDVPPGSIDYQANSIMVGSAPYTGSALPTWQADWSTPQRWYGVSFLHFPIPTTPGFPAIARSTDGSSWSFVQLPNQGYPLASLVECDDGTVLVPTDGTVTGCAIVVRSTDDGQSFQNAFSPAGVQAVNAYLKYFPVLNTLFAYVSKLTGGTGTTLHLSADQGQSFTQVFMSPMSAPLANQSTSFMALVPAGGASTGTQKLTRIDSANARQSLASP